MSEKQTLQYRFDGPEGGPVLVLGPALGATWHMWDRQTPELIRHWRVLRFDLPGHGGAPAQPPAGVGDLADRLLATLDRLGVDRFGYAGCSLSGAIGLDLARRHPERLASLAVIGTSARFDPAAVRTHGLDHDARTTPERWFTPAFCAAQPAIVDWAVQMVRTTDPSSYTAGCEALAAFDVRAELARIAVPTLVITGDSDRVAPPADARALVAGIPDARLAVVPHACQLAPVEQPVAVTDLLIRHFPAVFAPAPAPAPAAFGPPPAGWPAAPAFPGQAGFAQAGPLPHAAAGPAEGEHPGGLPSAAGETPGVDHRPAGSPAPTGIPAAEAPGSGAAMPDDSPTAVLAAQRGDSPAPITTGPAGTPTAGGDAHQDTAELAALTADVAGSLAARAGRHAPAAAQPGGSAVPSPGPAAGTPGSGAAPLAEHTAGPGSSPVPPAVPVAGAPGAAAGNATAPVPGAEAAARPGGPSEPMA
ncbi:alpha/beta fold hydrolase, partial [Streptomyces sp. NPDC049577]|uniref:alpha/beta fold hydrolase n=1 Tax=Streptomyces sp. NPDC049577 TaxID=3155153 RepID=UPI0034186775